MLTALEYTSLSIYGVFIVVCFVLGMARGKRSRKIVSHLVFFFLVYMMLLCWVAAKSAWTGVTTILMKNAAFSCVCLLIITNIVNKFSIYMFLHLLNLAAECLALYMSVVEVDFDKKTTWLEVAWVIAAVRFSYLFMEIVEGPNYNPFVPKVVITFNIVHEYFCLMFYTMSPGFQDIIDVRTMMIVMGILNLVAFTSCALFSVHYNWLSIARSSHTSKEKTSRTLVMMDHSLHSGSNVGPIAAALHSHSH